MSDFVSQLQTLELSWRAWGAEALAAAAQHQRPLMLLAGLDSDHWSAQLVRNLAADREALAALDAACVPVAVAVSAQPALAARIQQVLGVQGASGWPAIAFALPDGRLVGAIPYAPVRDAAKRAGLLRVALDVASAWQERPDDLRADAGMLASMGEQFADCSDERGLPAPGLCLDAAEAALLEHADTLEGGFGDAPRFHHPALLGFLLRRAPRAGAPPALRAQLERSLDALVAGAAHDHLGGGFFRAVQDRGWRHPFADKRLGDNAWLIAVLLEAAASCARGLYAAVAAHAIDWVRHALRAAPGWCHGLHADSPAADGGAVEGAAYAWSEAAVAEVIGRDAAARFARRYLSDPAQAVDDAGEWRVPAAHGELDPADADRLPAWCRRLAVARSERPQPVRCERVVAAEQGRWLRALVLGCAHPELGEAAWRADAAALAERLARTVDAEALAADPPALAEIGRGLAAWGEHAAAATCGERLRALVAEHAGLPVGIDPVLGAVCDPTDPPDGVAAPALAGELWLDLHAATGDARWSQACEQLLHAHAGVLRAAPMSCAGLAAVWTRWLG